MRWLQLTNSLGVFLVPPLVLMRWSKSSPQAFLGWRGASITPSGWGALLLIIAGSFFTIDALAHLNMVLLPEAPWVEELKAQEATVKLALDILLRDMVPTTLLANALIMVVVPAVGEVRNCSFAAQCRVCLDKNSTTILRSQVLRFSSL